MAGADHRWSELGAVPVGNGVRGNFLHDQAGMNLGQSFPTIDDFRNGFATSIKTTNATTPDVLLPRIQRYLNEMYNIENRTLGGKDANGAAITIQPGAIQAKGLLVAIPGSGAEMLKDPNFAERLEEMAKEADTMIEVVPVNAFEE